MNFDRVTITGADDSIRAADLIELTQRFPFVEWGILVSRANEGTPRYPNRGWIEGLKSVARTQPMNLSLHVCGQWVRQLLMGYNDLPFGIYDGFQRIQLNFHAENVKCYPLPFWGVLRDLSRPAREFIFQVDGASGNKYLNEVWQKNTGIEIVSAHPLFDVSGGAGVLPEEWPVAPDTSPMYYGYAGGLGPDNLEEQLPKIAAAAGKARFWIDMETRVRSSDDKQFDLAKVERCLEVAARFMSEAA